MAGDDTPTLVFPDYYQQELHTQLPDITLNLTSTSIKGKSRKLKSKMFIDSAQDLRDLWGEERFAQGVVERLAALTWSVHRDVVHIIGDLPEDLIPADVKDIAMGNILKLIPEKYWGTTWARGHGALEWEKSALGKITEVIKKRGLKDVGY